MDGIIPSEYSHSGRLGSAPVVVPIGGLIAALVLGIVYSYVIVYVPIVGYLSIIFVGLLVFGLVFTISKLGYLSQCRNAGFMHLTGFVVGLVALYSSWAAFVYALLAAEVPEFDYTLLDIMISPGGIWEFAKLINEQGWYSIFGVTPSGIGLWVIWGLEALLIVGGTALLATMHIQEGVFCEDCGVWSQRTESAAKFHVPEDIELDLQPDDLSSLMALEPADASAEQIVRVDTWQCNECSMTAALQVHLVIVETDNDGNNTQNVTQLTPIWFVSPETVKQVITTAVG